MTKMKKVSIRNFGDWLDAYFVSLNEIGGMPITKDNCEDMFENWVSMLDPQELIDFAEKWGDEVYMEGRAYNEEHENNVAEGIRELK